MFYLVAVSLLWAFSPGLTKGLTAGLDPSFVAAVRLGLALLVFLPFLRLKGVSAALALKFAGIGAVQFGVMYLAYNASFRLLQAHEVALFTLTTPVLVTLLADLIDRRFRARALAAALLAVGGTVVLVFTGRELRPTVAGLLLVQLSNLAFAFGQIAYKRLRFQGPALRDRDIFALLYAGAFLLALAAALTQPLPTELTSRHVVTLLYLCVIASGLGFFLWNKGATQVGTGTLAVMNNAKIPLMVACSLIFFGEYADLPRLAISLVLLTTAVWFAEKR
ncbi:MAG TPA: EamA family transporter [Lacunisphaera sp.]|nr:EamA family transporter [Lacunisphaera sp.]